MSAPIITTNTKKIAKKVLFPYRATTSSPNIHKLGQNMCTKKHCEYIGSLENRMQWMTLIVELILPFLICYMQKIPE